MKATALVLTVVATAGISAWQSISSRDYSDSGDSIVLEVSPVYQQTPVWCWAAVGEMVFSYYGVSNINPYGNMQCGIVALLHPACSANCGNCVVPAGSLTTMNDMLTRYPAFASSVTATATRISTTVARWPLSLAGVRTEIDAGRPVVAGISPSGYRNAGVSEHVALIIGYDGSDLIVNDPFPFVLAFSGDPYINAGGTRIVRGQYRIPYGRFVQVLQWQESIYDIRCLGRNCRNIDKLDAPDDDEPIVAYGRSCQTPITTCGPFYNQPALPVGSSCYCATPNGPSYGRVVR